MVQITKLSLFAIWWGVAIILSVSVKKIEMTDSLSGNHPRYWSDFFYSEPLIIPFEKDSTNIFPNLGSYAGLEISQPWFFEQHPVIVKSVNSSPVRFVAGTRFRPKPTDLLGSCQNYLIQSLIGRCCNENPRLEKVTLCQDVPRTQFGFTFASAQIGKIEGSGLPVAENYECGLFLTTRSPNTRIELICPVLKLKDPLSIKIFKDIITTTPINSNPLEENVVYTINSSVGFVYVFLKDPADRFTCNWKAML